MAVDFKTGDRVQYSREYLLTGEADPRSPLWEKAGVIVDLRPTRDYDEPWLVVQFDDEDKPRVIDPFAMMLEDSKEIPVDVTMRGYGMDYIFQPVTDFAREWIDQNVDARSWQWLGGILVVDRRYAAGLRADMVDDGLIVR